METIASSVIVGAISAVTFVAYRHPIAYAKQLGPLVATVLLVLLAAITLWNVAVDVTQLQLNLVTSPEKLSQAHDIAIEMSVPDWVFILSICLLGYVGFLGMLPVLLSGDGDTEIPKERW